MQYIAHASIGMHGAKQQCAFILAAEPKECCAAIVEHLEIDAANRIFAFYQHGGAKGRACVV